MITDNEVLIDHGGFINYKARKQYKCELASCLLPIEVGYEYFGLVVNHNRKHIYTKRFHRECFIPYIKEARREFAEFVR